MTTRAFFFALFLASMPGAARAGWSTSPIPNGVNVAVEQDTQDGLTAVADGKGGTIAVWRDLRDDHIDYRPYVQRLDAAGNESWTHSGIKIDARMGEWGNVEFDFWPALLPDGAGGASVFFNTTYWTGVQREHVGAGGSLDYPYEPLPSIDNRSGHEDVQCFADGQGNTFVFWHGNTSPVGTGIEAQKLDPSGQRLWGDSGLTLKAGRMNEYAVCPDGFGGFVIAYDSASVVRVLRIDGSGNSLWGPFGPSANGSFAGST